MFLDPLLPTLGKENCLFFKILSLMSLFSAVIILLVAISLIFKRDKMGPVYILVAVSPLVNYYIYLLFNSICEKAL